MFVNISDSVMNFSRERRMGGSLPPLPENLLIPPPGKIHPPQLTFPTYGSFSPTN